VTCPPPDPEGPITKGDPNQSPARGTRSTGYGEEAGAPAATWSGAAAPAGTATAPAPVAAPKTPSPDARRTAPPPPKPPQAVAFPPPDIAAECDAWTAKYPRREAALIPVLHVAQRKFGWISPAVEAGVAAYLGVSDQHVRGVVTFYTMFHTKPAGRHHLQVCRTLSCWLRGAPGLVNEIRTRTGLRPGETGKDGRFSVCEVECIGLCEVAPAIFVNDTAHGNVTPESLSGLLDGLA
jgi:NADH-quinone oxidoreductase subunit E